MRAVRFERYGPPEVLRVADVERPTPKEDEVLVRVHATTACRSDSGRRSAEYFITRFFNGFFRPKEGAIGMEFAGEVESAGEAVTELSVGDRVFGIGAGANAEYVCVREAGAIARIPGSMTFAEAAAVPDGGLSAISLLSTARLRKGQKILVYGASGSIGVGGVQVAKHLGAHVVNVEPRGTLVVLRNRDVPGVIGRVGTLLGDAGINIAEYQQARLQAGGDALAAISVDGRLNADVMTKLRAVPEVVEVRQVELKRLIRDT